MKVTLYKKDKRGRVQQWTVETQENKHRTIEGLIGGKLTISEWTECVGKNLGRSNETTPNEQAISEAESKAKRKREHGYYDDIEDADKGKPYIEPMLAHKYEQYGEQVLLNNTICCQPKLDGIRCIASRKGLFTRNGKQIVSSPHIFKTVKTIFENHPEIIAFDGELYNHELKHDFNKITSLVKRTKVSEEDFAETQKLVQYHIYDAIIKDTAFTDRLRSIERYHHYPYIQIVSTEIVNDEQFLDDIYAMYLEAGYEGQMIRIADSEYEFGRTKSLLKRKEFEDEECELLDVVEGNGNRSGMAGSVHCKHPNGNEFDANMRGGNDFYKELLENKKDYIGKMVTIRYQNLTPDGIPRFPVMIAVRDYE